MDLALGVAVAGPVARLALMESGANGQGVLDESVVNLAEDPIAALRETVVGTNRSLTDQHHRLVATRLCWSDARRAGQLRQALNDSGVPNVAVLSESAAATALVRSLSGGPRQRSSAVLLVDDRTARLSIVNGGEPKAMGEQSLEGSDPVRAAGSLLGRLRLESAAADSIYLISSSSDAAAIARQLNATSSLPLAVPDNPDFAIARGAALEAVTARLSYPSAVAGAPAASTGQLAFPAGDATMAAPAALTGRIPDPAAPNSPPAATTRLGYPAGDATMAAPAMPTGRVLRPRRRRNYCSTGKSGQRRDHGVRRGNGECARRRRDRARSWPIRRKNMIPSWFRWSTTATTSSGSSTTRLRRWVVRYWSAAPSVESWSPACRTGCRGDDQRASDGCDSTATARTCSAQVGSRQLRAGPAGVLTVAPAPHSYRRHRHQTPMSRRRFRAPVVACQGWHRRRHPPRRRTRACPMRAPASCRRHRRLR